MNINAFLKSLFFSFFYFLFIYGYSQQPTIIPPSPTAASLGAFGDIPVGYYTGTPDISIPLYEVKCGKLILPITLSYNATGIRVAQDASWVGLGWSLTAGGLVTRIIRGKDDFQGYFIDEKLPASNDENKYNPTNNVENDIEYFKRMKQGIIDGEPDIFSYNFGTYSGKFVIDKQANGSKVFTSQRNNLDITFESNGNSFTIKTPDGTKYLFGTKEEVISRYNNTWITDPSTAIGVNGLDKGNLLANSSWYLDKIISSTRDTIEFIYKYGKSLSLARKDEKKFDELGWFASYFASLPSVYNGLPAQYDIDCPRQYYEGSVAREFINDVYLSKIKFKNGWIDFETDDRMDIESLPNETKPQKLSKVKIYSFNGLTKEIDLGHSYFNQNATSYSGRRLKLDFVQVGEAANKYSFSYYDSDNLPNKYSRQVDAWGFYTYPFQGSSGYPSLLPVASIPDESGNGMYSTYPGVKEQRTDASGEYVKKGILTSITYPTKGRTEFDFEPHDFQNGISEYNTIPYTAILDYTDPHSENYIEEPIKTFTLSSGMYVHFTSSTDFHDEETNIAYLKNQQGAYLFIFNNTSNVSANLLLEAGTYTIEVKNISQHRTELRASYEVLNGFATKGNGVRIKSITNYDVSDHIVGKKRFIYTTTGEEGGSSSGTLLTRPKNYYIKKIGPYLWPESGTNYSYVNVKVFGGAYLVRTSSSYVPVGFYSQPNAVGYGTVCVKEGINDNNGSTIYNYYNVETDNTDLFPEIPETFDTRNGQLLTVDVLGSDGKPVKKTEFVYDRKEKLTVKGAKVYRAPFDNTPYYTYENDIRYYNNFSEWWVQSKKIETNYFKTGLPVLIDTVKYNYDDTIHKLITRSETIQSDKTKRIVSYKYSLDFATVQPYSDMVSKHIWEPIIEQTTYKNDFTHLLSATRTQYKDWGNSIIAPSLVESKTGTTDYDTRLHFDAYDSRGNVTTVSKENDVKTSYIWGYNKMYPIAEAVNAMAGQIAYTSFEADDLGGWTINPEAYILNSNVITGRHTGSCILNKTVPTGDYIVTMWAAANCAVNGQSATPLRVSKRDGWWRYFEWKLENVSNITVTGDNIDEVRLYPVGAQMTTYTYDPLVGLTTQTDANNSITYYAYDETGKLVTIRDQDYNVLKKYCYNYDGQIENCALYGNEAQSGTFTRNNCGPQYLSSSETYTVPKDMYYASTQEGANLLAQRDVQANGQAYANLHGTCTLPPYVRLEGQHYTYSDPYYSYEGVNYMAVFYTNAACTQRYTLPASLAVNYSYSNIYQNSWGYYPYYVNGSFTAEAGTSEYFWGWEDLMNCYNDGYGYYECTTTTVTLEPGTGYFVAREYRY